MQMEDEDIDDLSSASLPEPLRKNVNKISQARGIEEVKVCMHVRISICMHVYVRISIVCMYVYPLCVYASG